MKRLISLLMALVMVIGTSNTVEAYTGVAPWFTEEIEEAHGNWRIIPSSFDQLDLSENMTRAEFCEVLIKAYLRLYPEIPREVENNVFSDTNEYYVNTAYYLGITGGYPDGTFKPDETITREQIFTMISKFLIMYKGEYTFDSEQKSRIIDNFADSSSISEWAVDATAIVRYEGIVNGDIAKRINPKNDTTRAEGIIMVKRMLDSTVEPVEEKVVMNDLEEPAPVAEISSQETEEVLTATKQETIDPGYDSSSPLNRLGYNDAKQEYVYGSGDRFTSNEEALAHMVTISVDVWKLDSTGSKYASSASIKINKSIAERVKLVFDEIFAGDEQFPIHTVHSYAWRSSSTSEHNQGMAIDINANENYMIRNGSIVAGSYWKPGEDPLSIPEDGDVVNAFHKYGFSWGGNAWRSANDYMHFSYFGR